jgi:hypothetical protein
MSAQVSNSSVTCTQTRSDRPADRARIPGGHIQTHRSRAAVHVALTDKQYPSCLCHPPALYRRRSIRRHRLRRIHPSILSFADDATCSVASTSL